MNDILSSPSNQTVDLSGLPQPVVEGIRQLVQALKEEHSNNKAVPGIPGEESEPIAERLALRFISRPTPPSDELDRLLDELSSVSSGKLLPPDFSRADIYDDHD